MASIGHLPSDTKIYLSNKKLVNIKDIKIGDAVLSLKLPNIENKTRFDFLSYFIDKDLSDIENNFEISQSYVTSVSHIKNNINFLLFNNCLIYKNQPVLIYDKGIPKIMIANELVDMINEDRDLLKAKVNIEEENLNIFIKEKIDKPVSEQSDQISFYLNLLDNHLYFTENFIIFGGNL